VPDGDDIEIAYRLPVAWWGRGYATEMARAVLAHAFDTLALERVIGLTWPENVASQRVLERIGMRRDGSGQYYGREMFRYVAERSGRPGGGGADA
jgi:ribosomal-protein-alanine N-acetyltransferase